MGGVTISKYCTVIIIPKTWRIQNCAVRSGLPHDDLSREPYLNGIVGTALDSIFRTFFTAKHGYVSSDHTAAIAGAYGS